MLFSSLLFLLSSFLCGDEAYVSTTYWNPEKNIKEEFNGEERNNKRGFGLRLDVLGVNGYYTLRNQNIIDNKHIPNLCMMSILYYKKTTDTAR